MMKKSILFIACIGPILFCQNCRNPSGQQYSARDRKSDLLLIEEAVTNSICWAMDKDTVKLYGSLVQDSSLFILNPDSSFVFGFEGIRNLVENSWMDDRFKATQCLISNMRIDIAECGKAAWYYCVVNDISEWDGQESGWKNTRWTGVLEKQDKNWRIVQMHFSFAAGQ